MKRYSLDNVTSILSIPMENILSWQNCEGRNLERHQWLVPQDNTLVFHTDSFTGDLYIY